MKKVILIFLLFYSFSKSKIKIIKTVKEERPLAAAITELKSLTESLEKKQNNVQDVKLTAAKPKHSISIQMKTDSKPESELNDSFDSISAIEPNEASLSVLDSLIEGN